MKSDNFNRPTLGTLLNFAFQPPTKDEPIGFAIERILNFSKGNHDHPYFVICAPRANTRAKVVCAKTKKEFLNTSATLLVQRPNFTHSLKSLNAVYDDFAIFIRPEFFESAALSLGVDPSAFALFSNEVHLLKRSAWAHELIEQIFRAKIFVESRSSESLRQIVTELCRDILIQTGYIKLHGIGSKTESDLGVLSIVLSHIESHLFEDLRLEALAKTAGVSLSYLQKNFRKEFGHSPAEFIRKRRLEEARSALEQGNKTVHEVSELVGYKDSTAFTRAFSRHFSISPFKVKSTKR